MPWAFAFKKLYKPEILKIKDLKLPIGIIKATKQGSRYCSVESHLYV